MNNMPGAASKAVKVLVTVCALAVPAAACAPNLGPVGTALVIAALFALKLAPILFVWLVFSLVSGVWTRATRTEPLRGRVTVLQPLGF